jgi:hypothetical protein
MGLITRLRGEQEATFMIVSLSRGRVGSNKKGSEVKKLWRTIG